MRKIKYDKQFMFWPWLLLVITLVTALIYFLTIAKPDKQTILVTHDMQENQRVDKNLINTHENNSKVVAYLTFVDNNKNEMSLSHAYTNEALLLLVDAIESLSGELGYEMKTDIEKAKKFAEMITIDPMETTHADNIKKADILIIKALYNIQKAYYPTLANEIVLLRNAAGAINPDIMTLNQRKEVKAFFEIAADILEKMN